jgi:hypothetical protein
MRAVPRVLFLLVVAAIALAGLAEESSAALAGGSRLLFYHTQKSIVNPGAAGQSASTIIGITNASLDTAVSVRVQIFNGQNCASAGPFTFSVAGRQTLRLLVSDLAPPAQFPEGWVDVWAVNGGGAPIRWDQLAGKGTLLDFGGSAIATATYEAAALFSDRGGPQGDPIPDLNNGNTWGPLATTAEFWGAGGPFGVGSRLVVLPVSEIPGTAPQLEAPLIQFFPQGGGAAALTANNAPGCLVAAPLTALNPSFAATFPASGNLSGGGSVGAQFAEDSQNKGVVGALFEFGTAVAGLVVTPLQTWIGPTLESHE